MFKVKEIGDFLEELLIIFKCLFVLIFIFILLLKCFLIVFFKFLIVEFFMFKRMGIFK